MLPPLPKLSDYGLSSDTGFLPRDLPLERLPDAYYDRWESLLHNLQALILTRRIRESIRLLPILSTRYLQEEGEWHRAYLILSMLAHSYIWGGSTPEERVPPAISRPFKKVCAHLELPLVATYAGVCLWNWRPVLPDEPANDLHNLATLATFTGSMDESWFYLISVAIEFHGAPIIAVLLEAMAAARRNDATHVIEALQFTAERIDEIGSLLNKMSEQCDPHVFYHKIRPFLAGSQNMADAGLPNGVIFDTGSGDDEFVQYGGGSNAQSSLVQFFDVALGVKHRPTGVSETSSSQERHAEGPSPNFIQDMRRYMPAPHRRFLEDVEMVANLRHYVNENKSNEALVLAFDACLAMLRALRDKHIQIVSRYIIVKSRESVSGAPTRNTLNLANSRSQGNPRRDKSRLKGTGGTALIPFLKQARDETSEGVVDSWARRVLGEAPITSGYNSKRTGFVTALDKSAGAEKDSRRDMLVGLAGRWTMDDTEGGICHW